MQGRMLLRIEFGVTPNAEVNELATSGAAWMISLVTGNRYRVTATTGGQCRSVLAPPSPPHPGTASLYSAEWATRNSGVRRRQHGKNGHRPTAPPGNVEDAKLARLHEQLKTNI